MKIPGIEKPQANVVIVPIPRANSQDIIFKVQAVIDREPFDKLCPAPIPPIIVRKGGVKSANVEDSKYKEEVSKHARHYSNWVIIQSLKATEWLEWEKVDLSNPETWHLYEEEFKEAFLTDAEISRIVNGVYEANGLDEDKVDEARKRFLADQQEQ